MSSFGPRPIALAFMYIYISFEWSAAFISVQFRGADSSAAPYYAGATFTHTHNRHTVGDFLFFLSILGVGVTNPQNLLFVRPPPPLPRVRNAVDKCWQLPFLFGRGRRNTNIGSVVGHTSGTSSSSSRPGRLLCVTSYSKRRRKNRTNVTHTALYNLRFWRKLDI